MRVLIVEDNRRLAESIRDILKHWYDCDICGDGTTGCWLLKDGGYDAAVLDLMLPGMDGITLLRGDRRVDWIGIHQKDSSLQRCVTVR